MNSKKKKIYNHGKKNFMDVTDQDTSMNPFFGNVKGYYEGQPIQENEQSWGRFQTSYNENTLFQAQTSEATSNGQNSDMSNRIDQYLSPSNANSNTDRSQFSSVNHSDSQRIAPPPPPLSPNTRMTHLSPPSMESPAPPSEKPSYNNHPPMAPRPHAAPSRPPAAPSRPPTAPSRPPTVPASSSYSENTLTPLPTHPDVRQGLNPPPPPPPQTANAPINGPPVVPSNPRMNMMSELKEKLRKRQC